MNGGTPASRAEGETLRSKLFNSSVGFWLAVAVLAIAFTAGGVLWAWNYMFAILAGLGILPLVAAFIGQCSRWEENYGHLDLSHFDDRFEVVFSPPGLSISGIVILVSIVLGALIQMWAIPLGLIGFTVFSWVMFLIFGSSSGDRPAGGGGP